MTHICLRGGGENTDPAWVDRRGSWGQQARPSTCGRDPAPTWPSRWQSLFQQLSGQRMVYRFSESFVLSFFLGQRLHHMEVPRLRVKLELPLQPKPQPQQCQTLNPLSKARDRTRVLMDTSRVLNPLSHKRSSFPLPFRRQGRLGLMLGDGSSRTGENYGLILEPPASTCGGGVQRKSLNPQDASSWKALDGSPSVCRLGFEQLRATPHTHLPPLPLHFVLSMTGHTGPCQTICFLSDFTEGFLFFFFFFPKS